ncbi:unnamed protein product, partial [marine sediment metagenome]
SYLLDFLVIIGHMDLAEAYRNTRLRVGFWYA